MRRALLAPAVSRSCDIGTLSRTDPGVEQMIYELTPDAIELGLAAGLPAVFELSCSMAEFGRGERTSPSLTQRSVRFLMINRTPPESLLAAARSA